MNVSHVKIGPFSVDIRNKQSILKDISERISSGTRTHIITINSLMFNEALKNQRLKSAIDGACIVIPESIGIKLANMLLNGVKTEKMPGIDLIFDICSLCSSNAFSVYLLGSKGNISKIASEKLKEQYPDLKISGTSDGYFFGSKDEENKVINSINTTKADVLFVGLNSPQQEIWISENLINLGASIVIGVGGSFDVISGNLKRAPILLQKLGLEWLFRLIQEPSRFLRMTGLPIFALNVLKLLLRGVKREK